MIYVLGRKENEACQGIQIKKAMTCTAFRKKITILNKSNDKCVVLSTLSETRLGNLVTGEPLAAVTTHQAYKYESPMHEYD